MTCNNCATKSAGAAAQQGAPDVDAHRAANRYTPVSFAQIGRPAPLADLIRSAMKQSQDILSGLDKLERLLSTD